MRYAMSISGFWHLNILESLKKAQQLGFDSVESSYVDLFSLRRGPRQRYLEQKDFSSRVVIDKILQAYSEHNVIISGVHGPVVPLNDSDVAEREWVNKEAFERMRLLGTSDFTVHAGSGTVKNLEQEFPLIEKNLVRLSEIAADYDINVCVESGCCPYELRHPDDIADLLDRHPKLSHTSDLSHFFCQRPDYDPIAKTLQRMGSRIRVVHIVDYDPGSPWSHDLPAGMGIIDWKRFMRGLLKKGFDGTLVVENSPDATSRFLLKLRQLATSSELTLPSSTVSTGIIEPDSAKVLGHDPYMTRSEVSGIRINWENIEESWDNSMFSDRLYQLSLNYIKSIMT